MNKYLKEIIENTHKDGKNKEIMGPVAYKNQRLSSKSEMCENISKKSVS